MTEYGGAIVEAAAKAARDALDASMASVPGDDLPPLYDSEAERAARAALLAAIDRLIEAGPSEGMVEGLYDEPHLEYRDDYISKEAVVAAFRTMLRALRAEIEEAPEV